MADISIASLIAPAFYEAYHAARELKYRDIWLMGGRGSGKSSFVSVMLVLGLLEDRDASAIVYRKVADTLRESVYAQVTWAIDRLGMTELFRFKLSPLEIECAATGQKIMFRGADRPEKSKGIKLPSGYFKYLWFEELTEFDSMADVRTIKASVIRGGPKGGDGGSSVTFYTYNPPMSMQNWVNAEALLPAPGRLVCRSDYLGMPPEWLGSTFLLEAEALKAGNERAYRHMYLGEITGTGGLVFGNLKLRRLDSREYEGFKTYSGLDFGFATDPDAYVRCAFDRKRKRLMIIAEMVATGLSISALAREVRDRCGSDVITADSAEPRSISELRAHGLRVTAARKGPDSVEHGMRYLSSLAEIVIDPNACPYAAREFSMYEYQTDGRGGFLPSYPDKCNHTIDAVRYALEPVSGMLRGVVVS